MPNPLQQATSTTVGSLTLSSNATVGNLVVLEIASLGATAPVVTGLGATWGSALKSVADGGSGYHLYQYAAVVQTAGTLISWTNGNGDGSRASEWSGYTTTADGTNGATSVSNPSALAPGNITTTDGTDLIVASCYCARTGTGTPTVTNPGSPWIGLSQEILAPKARLNGVYQIVSSTGSFNPSFAFSGATDAAAIIVAYEAASSGAATGSGSDQSATADLVLQRLEAGANVLDTATTADSVNAAASVSQAVSETSATGDVSIANVRASAGASQAGIAGDSAAGTSVASATATDPSPTSEMAFSRVGAAAQSLGDNVNAGEASLGAVSAAQSAAASATAEDSAASLIAAAELSDDSVSTPDGSLGVTAIHSSAVESSNAGDTGRGSTSPQDAVTAGDAAAASDARLAAISAEAVAGESTVVGANALAASGATSAAEDSASTDDVAAATINVYASSLDHIATLDVSGTSLTQQVAAGGGDFSATADSGSAMASITSGAGDIALTRDSAPGEAFPPASPHGDSEDAASIADMLTAAVGLPGTVLENAGTSDIAEAFALSGRPNSAIFARVRVLPPIGVSLGRALSPSIIELRTSVPSEVRTALMGAISPLADGLHNSYSPVQIHFAAAFPND